MNALDEAILRTVLYADVFDFPLNAREIAHFLIADTPFTVAQIEYALAHSASLAAMLNVRNGMYFCHERDAILDIRHERERASHGLWQPALKYGGWLAYLPFVRMVALTGALAMRNASAHDDDLDYVLVTAPRRVWLARAFAVLLVRVIKLRGIVICPNYVLSESALTQQRRDLFMAHEVAQMIPLYGRALYERMRAENDWVWTHLPNAHGAYFHECERGEQRAGRLIKRVVERLLSGKIGDALEAWEQRRKRARFAPALQTPYSAAQLDAEHVKGHFNDHGHPVLSKYRERLRRYGLERDALPLAGD